MNRIALVLSCLLLSACASAPLPLRKPESVAMLSVDEFPGATGLLDGFDARRTDNAWATGDQILFGLRLRKGATVQRWLLQLRVVLAGGDPVQATLANGAVAALKPAMPELGWSYTATIAGERKELSIRSTTSLVSVKVFDEDGKQLGKSTVTLPSDLMGRGLLPGIECALRQQRAGSDFTSFASEEEVRPMGEGLIALVALLNVVQNDDVLQDYFWQVVQKPSIWSVITGLGIKASLTASLEQSVPVVPPMILPTTSDAFAMPLRVDVNDTPALVADVIAIEAARPFSLCGGIIAASARHPTEPDLRFDVQLLAARVASREPTR